MSAPLSWRSAELADGVRQEGDLQYDVIAHLDAMAPFLTSVASASDVWLYLGSHGGVTAGRRSPDHAIFPYVTQDKLFDTAAVTGAVTVVRADDGTCWEPTAAASGPRWLARSVTGDEVVWGADHTGLGLVHRESWRAGPTFGVVRECRLTNEAPVPRRVDILDGFHNLLPAGTPLRTQNELSVLLDAYKRSEVDAATSLGVYSLSSQLTDLAEPSEALAATVAWRLGPGVVTLAASDRGLDRFRRGGSLVAEPDARGVRCAHLAGWTVTLAPGESVGWLLVTDTGLDTAAVHNLHRRLADHAEVEAAVREDLARARDELERLLAVADGYQVTGDERSTAHHLSCVLNNAMRGGVPRGGYRIGRDELRRHLAAHNRPAADRATASLAALPDVLTPGSLDGWGRSTGDPDLARLAGTYLPLSFSRRHGDPSRPWNRFEIVLKDATGSPTVGFQGNWRDVFQNWEALAWAYPEFTEPMIRLFVNATTVDGYNPYRLTHLGIDWEVPEPDNPWSNIGYWGDHQIVYLLRLLQHSERVHPGRLAAELDVVACTFADVPYRIAGLDETLADPRSTIAFDADADARARARAERIGADGLLRHDAAGDLARTTLADKLLTLAAAKLVNLVPDAGIWMNTQRPEWNDANNALAGPGVSVVTAAYLIGYLKHVSALLGDRPVRVRRDLRRLLKELADVLDGHDATTTRVDGPTRRAMLVDLGRAGERYRHAVYGDRPMDLEPLPAEDLGRFLGAGAAWLDRSVRAARRPDGLFHSYFVLEVGDAEATVRDLPLMLEGQVALLASGLLSPEESVEMATGLRGSALYREDQHSYLLYPDRDLPGFLERNTVPPDVVDGCPAAHSALVDPRGALLVRDEAGGVHFANGIRNARVLAERIERAVSDGVLESDPSCLLDAYERTFHHSLFTGRSGSFFAYEGLGSVYWHMVSKLALAVLEARQRAGAEASAARLRDAFRDIRAGLGHAKSPYSFGAFPTEAYSHTPKHAGAQQPGMTGQVKEDIIIRLTELGVSFDAGEIRLDPGRVEASEWLEAPAALRFVDGVGRWDRVAVPAGHLAFTLCGIPVVYRRGGDRVRAVLDDGSERGSGPGLGRELSTEVLRRTGRVAAVWVD